MLHLIRIKKFITSNVFRTIFILSLIIVIGSYLEYIKQKNLPGTEIKNPRLAIWFVFQTVTTVGYGDVVPIDMTGRIIAIIIMLAGIGTVSYLMLKRLPNSLTMLNLTYGLILSPSKPEAIIYKGVNSLLSSGTIYVLMPYV